MLVFQFIVLAALCAGSASCENITNSRAPRISDVKTTAYTHTESDHLKYRTATAAGGTLKYGATRSAAADWSVYPVGTIFKIEGDQHLYEVDDYGSALVGTKTIDLYKPSQATMKEWGSRKVDINVIKWGSETQSLAILKPRVKSAPHIAQMIKAIQQNTAG
ncbi:MAG: 3D domain-containing protein [Verrucomicrobia bacterium]|nr:3D domain-containing protein [Verrucomicrobiota bacterium]